MSLLARLATRQATVGILGLGHAGLPLAVATAETGYRVIGFDIQRRVVATICAGRSPIGEIADAVIARHVNAGKLEATDDFQRLRECDVLVMCVPTPLNKMRDPDLSYVVEATKAIQKTLRPEQLIILESTTYPGTTREVVLPILEQPGLRVGQDFFLCFSPERVDPGNKTWRIENTPRLIGGITHACLERGQAFLGSIVQQVHRVSSVEIAELAKVYENTFRLVNIALANELARICHRLRLDVWEVIEAASTKPFGFMRFTPGPGLGGHCIPLDPRYLAWKMQMLDFKTRLIDLASEINASMPAYVVGLLVDALNDDSRAVKGSDILVVGVAYKPDVGDDRESPAHQIMELLMERGAHISYYDPYCPRISVASRSGSALLELNSIHDVDLATKASAADAVIVVTDHRCLDYELFARSARLIIDCRGAMRGLECIGRVITLSGTTAGEDGAASQETAGE